MGHVPSSDSPTTRNAGPMSIPNPVGMPGGSVTRNGSPACGGMGRRLGRIGMTLGAIDGPLEVRREPAHRPEHGLRRGLDQAVAEVHGPVGLAGLPPAPGASLLGVVHGEQGDDGRLPRVHPALSGHLRATADPHG